MDERPTDEALAVAWLPSLRALQATFDDLKVEWVAHNPIQGEATEKVVAYRVAEAALTAALPTLAKSFAQDVVEMLTQHLSDPKTGRAVFGGLARSIEHAPRQVRPARGGGRR
jgi:hypothetical protein